MNIWPVVCVACGVENASGTCPVRRSLAHDLRYFDRVTRTFGPTSLNVIAPEEIVERCRALCARDTKPTLPEVRPLVQAYYELPDNGAGGELHVVLDDGNWERVFVRGCIERATKPETRWLGHVLLLLSNSQRRKL